MPASSAKARIWASSCLSCIGPKRLNKGATQIGSTSMTKNITGSERIAVYSHHRRGLRRISQYGSQTNSPPKASPTAPSRSDIAEPLQKRLVR